MKLTATQKQVLIEVHPDRHGGDHSRLDRLFAALRRPSQAMSAIRRCVFCGVRIGGVRTCRTHRYVRRAIACLVLTTSAFAGDVWLKWDASPESGITNYVLYGTTNATLTSDNMASAQLKVNVGTNLIAHLESVGLSLQWKFGVTAMKGGAQSALSNILPVEFPSPPANARTAAIAFGIDLSSMTNHAYFKVLFPMP